MNCVVEKITPIGFGGFISVPFDSVLPLADEYRDGTGVLKTRLQNIFNSKKLF